MFEVCDAIPFSSLTLFPASLVAALWLRTQEHRALILSTKLKMFTLTKGRLPATPSHDLHAALDRDRILRFDEERLPYAATGDGSDQSTMRTDRLVLVLASRRLGATW